MAYVMLGTQQFEGTHYVVSAVIHSLSQRVLPPLPPHTHTQGKSLSAAREHGLQVYEQLAQLARGAPGSGGSGATSAAAAAGGADVNGGGGYGGGSAPPSLYIPNGGTLANRNQPRGNSMIAAGQQQQQPQVAFRASILNPPSINALDGAAYGSGTMLSEKGISSRMGQASSMGTHANRLGTAYGGGGGSEYGDDASSGGSQHSTRMSQHNACLSQHSTWVGLDSCLGLVYV